MERYFLDSSPIPHVIPWVAKCPKPPRQLPKYSSIDTNSQCPNISCAVKLRPFLFGRVETNRPVGARLSRYCFPVRRDWDDGVDVEDNGCQATCWGRAGGCFAHDGTGKIFEADIRWFDVCIDKVIGVKKTEALETIAEYNFQFRPALKC